MEIEILKAMNEGMYPGLLTMMQAIALITVFFAAAALVASLASIARLCLQEAQRHARKQMKPAPKRDGLDSSSALVALEDDSSGSLISSVTRRKPAFQRISIK